jgi:class 3 adenylate cyclase
MEPQASAKVSAQDLKLLKDRGDHPHDISGAFSCNTMLEFIRFGIKRSFTGSAGSIIKAARWTADHPRVVLRRLGTVSISIVCMCVVLFIVVHIHVNIHALRRSIVTLSLVLAVLAIANRWGRLESIVAALVGALGFDTFFQEPFGSLLLDAEGLTAVFFFLLSAILISQLSLRARERAVEALKGKYEAECLYKLGQALLSVDRFDTAASTVIDQIVSLFGARSAAIYMMKGSAVQCAGASDDRLSFKVLSDVAESQCLTIDSKTLTGIVPLEIGNEPFGSVGISGVALSETVLRSIGNLLVVVFERVQSAEALKRRNVELDHQRQVSESLLLNILPAEVADELRTKGMVSPKYFEDVTIMFTDFVGFSTSTEHLAAEDVVEQLHGYFTAFDRICTRYGLEKLKTIGDSYMCIGGLPTRNPAHPVNAVMAALEMLQEVVERDRPDSLVSWKVRIGIHTGPVVAGVVGINKFAFDIWGDTVNFSSRMESSGEPNRINISEHTYSRIKDFFECEYRGKVLTKDKRAVDMYFANGILPKLLAHGKGNPPPAFVRRFRIYFNSDPPAFPAFLLSDQNSLESVNS